MSERELLEAARRGDEDAYGRLVEPHRARAARPLLPDARLGPRMPRTRCRRRCCAPGAGCRGSRAAARCASWLYTIATNACLKAIERRPRRVLPIDYGPAADPHDGPARAARRVGVGRALPGRAAGPRRRAGRSRGPLRAARERRARLHRGAPAPAGAPARRADPARRARLLGPARSPRRSRRRPPRCTAPCSAPTRRVDERLPEQSQQATLRALGDDALREIVDALRRPPGSAATSTRVVAMLAEDATIAMPPMPTWYRGRDAVAAFLARWPLAPGDALAPGPRARQRAAGLRLLPLGRRAAELPRAQRQRAHAARHTDRRDHRLPHAGALRALRPARRDDALSHEWRPGCAHCDLTNAASG